MRTDYELLQAWSTGDDDAGSELVRRHYKRVYGFVRSKVEQRTRDLVQRTFLVCLEKHANYQPDASFPAFLFGIARLTLFEHFRGMGKAERFDPLLTSVHDVAPSPSRIVMQQQEHKLLLAALRAIPVDAQITLELFYWEEMPVEEVAAVLGVAPGTVKSRLHRARQQLREAIESMQAQPVLMSSTLDGFEQWAASLRKILQTS